jgi:hypothetical protein
MRPHHRPRHAPVDRKVLQLTRGIHHIRLAHNTHLPATTTILTSHRRSRVSACSCRGRARHGLLLLLLLLLLLCGVFLIVREEELGVEGGVPCVSAHTLVSQLY